MNRTFFVMLVGLGVTISGCATDVDDPIPPATAEEEQREPPGRTLGTDLRDPQALLISGIEIDRGLERVAPKQSPPLPEPNPEKH